MIAIKYIVIIVTIFQVNLGLACQCHGYAKSFFQNIGAKHHVVHAKVVGHAELEMGPMLGISNSVTFLEIINDYTGKLNVDTVIFINGGVSDCMATFHRVKLNSEFILKGVLVDYHNDEAELKSWDIPDSVIVKEKSYFELFRKFKNMNYGACDIGSLSVANDTAFGNITRNDDRRRFKASKRRRLISNNWAKRYLKNYVVKTEEMNLSIFENKLRKRINAQL